MSDDPSLTLQIAIRQALISSPNMSGITVFDRAKTPEIFPCVIIGEGQNVAADINLGRDYINTYLDLHIWTKEDNLASVKKISGTVKDIIKHAPANLSVIDLKINSTRFLRDPSGDYSHGVITVEALMKEFSE
ncbi:DUF3168 domain-containing protein [Beijerinckia mobilis]|uniref:DUF3168 domain-containing protein n=1 Tax=Beijerinckia mobilis TaxID=231434 RepID=UPI0005514D2A|nr:DUF3168 domain-containing protein [Beijerinckia mobilis]